MLAKTLPPVALASGASMQAAQRLEYEIRAALILSFSRLTEWPSSADPKGEFVIGLMGEDVFGPCLEALEALPIKGRKVRIRHFRNPSEFQPCHVLYFSTASEKYFPAMRDMLIAKGVLTIGESEDFVDRGGILRFLNDEDRIRYIVNRKALSQTQLQMPAKVLSLAKSLR